MLTTFHSYYPMDEVWGTPMMDQGRKVPWKSQQVLSFRAADEL